MTALTDDRQTRLLSVGREWRTFPVAAAAVIFAGALVALNAGGYLVPASTSTTLDVVGTAQARADNSSGANGDLECEIDTGIGRYVNSSAADEVSITEIGEDVFAVDDQTVAKTAGGTAQVSDATLTFNGTDIVGVTIQGITVSTACVTDAEATIDVLVPLLEEQLDDDFTFTDATTKITVEKKTGGKFSIVPYTTATAAFVIATTTPGVAQTRSKAGKVHLVDSTGVYVDFRK